MSALQALERFCDQLVEIKIPLENIVAILLDGCENLAMVGFVVGMLVRHIEDAGGLLDPFLSEPVVWHQEFSRTVHESTGLAASSDGIAHAERRSWSLRHAAMLLVVRADELRSAELVAIGQRLVETTRRLVVEALGDDADEAEIDAELVTVRAWASSLDRATYEAHAGDGGVYIQSRPPEDVTRALEQGNQELQHYQDALRLMVRYHIGPKQGAQEPLTADELVSDLAVAQDLADSAASGPSGSWDAPASVAATALEAHVIREMELPIESLHFAADLLLRIGSGEPGPRAYEFEESYFEQGADRSAARALSHLLLPAAAALRASLDAHYGSSIYATAASAASNLARSNVGEVRVHLARGFDRVWEAPCAIEGVCHHETALEIVVGTMRDSVFGPWDAEIGGRKVKELSDPVGEALDRTAAEDIYVSRLDAAIRALGPVARAGICISQRANDLLAVVLNAHRRALLAHKEDMDQRGTHTLIAARSLLTIAAAGEDGPIWEHIDAYADNSTLMNAFLRALSAAAEETRARATTASRLWPSIVQRVLGHHNGGHRLFEGRYYGDQTLASLLPNAAGEVAYLYRELDGEPIAWWRTLSWPATVEQWLVIARGNATCADQLIGYLRPRGFEDQVRIGLPWVSVLILHNPANIANRSFLVSSWLIEIRETASNQKLDSEWQQVVDALVVAGESRLAPYSE